MIQTKLFLDLYLAKF